MSSVLSMGHKDEDAGSDDDDDAETDSPSFAPSNPRLKLSDSTQDALQLFSRCQPLLLSCTLQFHSVNGRTYCRVSRHKGNSSVLVKTASNLKPIPAQIQDIIQTNTGNVLFAIRYHGGISLWTEPKEPTTIISPMSVHSHFASCSFPTKLNEVHIAVISLNQVCQAIRIYESQ